MVRWSFFVTFAAMEKKYTADELSYIGFVARKYCNLCEPGWEEYVVENALDLFQWRIGMIDCASNYDLYKSTETMQAKVEKYDFDTEKFWLLLLFLKDFTESCFGESWVFDEVSVADNIKKMLDMLDASTCELSISNKTESAHINTLFIKDGLKELLLSYLQSGNTNIYPCVHTTQDNVLWHKVKFFMDMLDFFLVNNIPANANKTSNRKDWTFTAQILYIVGYLEDKKYLVGYEVTERTLKDIDGNTTVKMEETPVKDVGKYIKDNTKCCKVTPNRNKSCYCYNPYLDMID